ncbi:MAG: ABC transporter permease subunit, partial [Deltaproteobacteria bacterium]|nr:ABC transporter permease subunit [Deltaproteobacteria bacterium]
MLSIAKRYPARGAAALLLLLLIWYAVAFYVRLARQAEFPLPQETATAFLRLLANQDKILDHSLYAHLGASLERWFMGYTAGVAWGLGLGLAGAMLPGVGRTLAPLLSVIHLIPGLAWMPIAILLVGGNQRTAILLISLTAMPPVILSLQQGLKATPEEFIMISRMCGEGPGRRFFTVQLPAALPYLITGLRLALANSWRVVV